MMLKVGRIYLHICAFIRNFGVGNFRVLFTYAYFQRIR